MQKLKKEELFSASGMVGIDIVGYTNNYDSDKINDYLKMRKKKNYDTEFEFSIKDRLEPKQLLKNYKTIIAIGESYNYLLEKEDYELKAYVSKSAVGLDYHILLKEKMEMLVDKLKKDFGYSFEYFIGVDTAPLVDREIALTSLIGKYGKNKSIINDIYGSFIFIGYILVDILIDEEMISDTHKYGKQAYGNEIADKCIGCDLCIKACPTKAIREGDMMNSKICLSYLTQTKNKIPYEFREKMNKMIYGCDICQNVCPYNKNIPIKKESLVPKITNENIAMSKEIDLEELLFISNKQFKKKYGNRAFSWRGKNILRRNAIVYLSKTNSQKTINILLKLIKDDSDMIREYAFWALYKVNKNMAIEYKSGFEDELERIEKFYAK